MTPKSCGLSTSRVAYLEHAYELFRTALLKEAPPCSEVAFAYSFPSRGARGRAGRIGECHYGRLAGSETDERFLLLVHPSEWVEDILVLAVLAHEMIHAALGRAAGHGPRFAALARRMGLAGKPTATVAGPAFACFVDANRKSLPPFPAGALHLAERRVQGTRLRLYECHCTPVIKLRCARDDLRARCELCGAFFAIKAEKTVSRLECAPAP